MLVHLPCQIKKKIGRGNLETFKQSLEHKALLTFLPLRSLYSQRSFFGTKVTKMLRSYVQRLDNKKILRSWVSFSRNPKSHFFWENVPNSKIKNFSTPSSYFLFNLKAPWMKYISKMLLNNRILQNIETDKKNQPVIDTTCFSRTKKSRPKNDTSNHTRKQDSHCRRIYPHYQNMGLYFDLGWYCIRCTMIKDNHSYSSF